MNIETFIEQSHFHTYEADIDETIWGTVFQTNLLNCWI